MVAKELNKVESALMVITKGGLFFNSLNVNNFQMFSAIFMKFH
jgi:hypothetical protein